MSFIQTAAGRFLSREGIYSVWTLSFILRDLEGRRFGHQLHLRICSVGKNQFADQDSEARQTSCCLSYILLAKKGTEDFEFRSIDPLFSSFFCFKILSRSLSPSFIPHSLITLRFLPASGIRPCSEEGHWWSQNGLRVDSGKTGVLLVFWTQGYSDILKLLEVVFLLKKNCSTSHISPE